MLSILDPKLLADNFNVKSYKLKDRGLITCTKHYK